MIAASVLIIIPTLVFYLIIQKKLIRMQQVVLRGLMKINKVEALKVDIPLDKSFGGGHIKLKKDR